MENFVTISGCSGGGKTTLLVELRRRGFATNEEPGRRIVAEELKRGGRALPWIDAVAFAGRAIEVSLAGPSLTPTRPGSFSIEASLMLSPRLSI
jgi:predicted ATPase